MFSCSWFKIKLVFSIIVKNVDNGNLKSVTKCCVKFCLTTDLKLFDLVKIEVIIRESEINTCNNNIFCKGLKAVREVTTLPQGNNDFENSSFKSNLKIWKLIALNLI